MTRLENSGCSGLSKKFRSTGTITLGTDNTTLAPASAHASPICRAPSLTARACQSLGRSSSLNSRVSSSGRRNLNATYSLEKPRRSACTRVSSTARERLELL